MLQDTRGLHPIGEKKCVDLAARFTQTRNIAAVPRCIGNSGAGHQLCALVHGIEHAVYIH